MQWLSSISRRKRFRITLRAAFLVVGVLAAFAVSLLVNEKHYLVASVPMTIVLIAALAEFVFGDVLTEKRYPTRTEAILNNYQSSVQYVHDQLVAQLRAAITSLRGCDSTKVNGTLHLVVELYCGFDDSSEPAFVQITSYSGQLGGRQWRFTAASKGLIGRCLRTGVVEHVNFSTQEDYDDRMVREFGYTSDEIRKHTMVARSYWAQPLRRENAVIGVLFLFSTEPQLFPRAADQDALDAIGNNIVGILEVGGVI